MNKKQTVLIHSIVWLMFIAYEVSFVWAVSPYVSTFLDYSLHYTANILLFYTNAWCLAYSIRTTNKSFYYSCLIAVVIICYFMLQYLINEILIYQGMSKPITSVKHFLLLGGYRAFYMLCLSFGYWFFTHSVETSIKITKLRTRQLVQNKKKAELERTLFKTRNAYLQSQINPHLLFNTLNFLYNSVYHISEKSAEGIMLLSDLMRYSLTELGTDGKVELTKEIENIETVIAINQLRFDQKLQVNLITSGELDNKRLIPLILLTFVENIFKHGIILNTHFPAEIKINVHDGALSFSASNHVNPAGTNKQGFEIGIVNTRTRLNAAYPEKHRLKVTQTDHLYTVDLFIQLD
ncbi:histidine kinase [Mucilaginibacter sp. CSA2-8R]|uniref:sensor histidine kinase n=1 Tax=Mucilaginibacter sp. CSA2-8R TaxID=3141542 RepID=UPI00315D48EA